MSSFWSATSRASWPFSSIPFTSTTLGRHLAAGGAPEEVDPGLPGRPSESAGDGDGLGDGRLAPEVVLAGALDVARDDEGRVLEVLNRHADDRIAQERAVRVLERARELPDGPARGRHVADAAHRDVTVRPNRRRRVELGGESEIDSEDVSRLQRVGGAVRGGLGARRVCGRAGILLDGRRAGRSGDHQHQGRCRSEEHHQAESLSLHGTTGSGVTLPGVQAVCHGYGRSAAVESGTCGASCGISGAERDAADRAVGGGTTD